MAKQRGLEGVDMQKQFHGRTYLLACIGQTHCAMPFISFPFYEKTIIITDRNKKCISAIWLLKGFIVHMAQLQHSLMHCLFIGLFFMEYNAHERYKPINFI